VVPVPEARNGCTELHWCIWHLHRASDAIISDSLRFASSAVSHYAPHTRSVSFPRIYICISYNFIQFHTICSMFPQTVEEYKRVVENLTQVQAWKPPNRRTRSKYDLFMSAIFSVRRSLFMAMIWYSKY